MGDVTGQFGARIRLLREQQRLTLQELAFRAGVDPSHLGQIERGSRDLRLRTVARIAKGLGITPAQLLKGIGVP